MSLEALANIGEAIGGIGVLLTLVYLAVQTRQNTTAVRAATVQQVVDSFAEVTLEISKDHDLAEIMVKAQRAPDSLSPVEAMRYGMLLVSFCRRAESMFFQREEGTVEQETWLGIQDSIGRSLSGEWPATWWKDNRSRFNPKFQEYVEREIFAQHPPAV